MSISIKKLKGVTVGLAALLRAQGIRTSDDLLEMAATEAQRQALARRLDVAPQLILAMANRADLARINGIGGIYGDLLEHSGVDTVQGLATRRPDNLHRAISNANQAKGLAKMPPSEDMVEGWIKQARNICRVLQH